MDQLFWIFIIWGTLLGVSYLFLIGSYCYAWIKTREEVLSTDTSAFISIIIAARNEEKEISDCLDAVFLQNYPKEKYEVIVIDDHSTDATGEILKAYEEKNPRLKILDLSKTTLFGKKQALDAGIKIATGEMIVTTDADCTMGNNWLKTIACFYKQTNAKMIVAPVTFHQEKTLFEKMQSLEFMALMACGGASLYFNKAIMCNGANLAYTKTAYNEVGGLDDLNTKASGDDVLLMYKIKKKYPGEVRFLKNKDAIVYTKAKRSLREFLSQRKRWASKGFWALNAETRRTALLIYFFSLYLVLVPVIGLFCFRNTAVYPFFKEFCLILIGIKCFIDFLLLFLSASYFKKKRFLYLFLPEQIIYLFYVVIFGGLGSIGKYDWKGRKTN